MVVNQGYGMRACWNRLWLNLKRVSMGIMFMKTYSIWQQLMVIIFAGIIPFTTAIKERL